MKLIRLDRPAAVLGLLTAAAWLASGTEPAFGQRGRGRVGAGGNAPVYGSIEAQLTGGISGTPYATSGFSPFGGTTGIGVGANTGYYGGYGGYGLGYGGYGGYGLGYGGYGLGYRGYGGYGGYGYGGYGGYGYGFPAGGISPASIAYQAQLEAAQTRSRYNLQNAEAVEAYQGANLMRAEAYDALSEANVNNSNARSNSSDQASEGVPLSNLFARDGEVLWPLGAPTDGELGTKRDAASAAIQEVVTEFAADREVPTRKVIEARQALSDYAVPAARYFEKTEDKQDEKDWENWVSNLDRGLRTLAGIEPPPTGRPNPAAPTGRGDATRRPNPRGDAPDIQPEGVPKSAGEVFRESLRNRSGGETSGTPKASEPKDKPPA